MQKEKIIAKTYEATYTIGSREVDGKPRLDYVWVQKNNGWKGFYRKEPQGAELLLTAEVLKEAVDAVCKDQPSQIDELGEWIDSLKFYKAMIEAYEAFMQARSETLLYYNYMSSKNSK